MGIIYKEFVSHKKVPYVKGAVLLFLILLNVNLTVNSVHYSRQYNIELEALLIVDAVIAAIMLKAVFDVVYKQRICYMYRIIDKELIFEKMIGNSRKVVLNVDAKDIQLFVPAPEAKKTKDIDVTYKFLCGSSKNSAYCCVANDNGKKMKFFFQPSDELIRKLKIVMANS